MTVDEINKKNQELYGPRCVQCDLYQAWCRCDSYKEWHARFKNKKPINKRMKYIEYRQNASRTLSDIKEMHNIESDELLTNLNLLHCIIGIMTEVQELREGLVFADETNMKEELGDMMWYIANYDNINNAEDEELPEILVSSERFDLKELNDCAELLLDMWKKKVFYNSSKYNRMIENTFALLKHNVVKFCNAAEWDLEVILATNIAKLKERYPEKFTTADSDNRNLDSERKILEG